MTRGCSADSGTTTADTEIVRISHCGAFYFDNKYVHLESISTERELLNRYWGNVKFLVPNSNLNFVSQSVTRCQS